MRRRTSSIGLVGMALLIGTFSGTCAIAAESEIIIGQDGAVAGHITDGDAPGFPVTLAAPGRYRLTSNLAPPPGADGIVIEADNVTIDFNGFSLDGGGKAGTGIASVHDAIEIKNGVVTGFQLFAIDSHSVGKFWTISGMRVIKNGLGVSAGGYARVVGNNISLNDNYGLGCQFCLVEGNVVALNHDDGIDVKGGTVLGNMIASNRGFGISAFMLGYVLSGYGNNTLINNAGAGKLGSNGRFIAQSPQVSGRLEELQPNVE